MFTTTSFGIVKLVIGTLTFYKCSCLPNNSYSFDYEFGPLIQELETEVGNFDYSHVDEDNGFNSSFIPLGAPEYNRLSCATLPNFMRRKNTKFLGIVAVSPIPWHVLIWDDFFPHTCGGVILDHLTILTASKCFDSLDRELDENKNGWTNNFRIHISTGSTRRKGGQNLGLRTYLKKLPKFPALAILKLTVPIELGYNSQPACLPTPKESLSFKQCYYCGWNNQAKLRWYQITINQRKCKGLKGFNPSTQLCTRPGRLNKRDSGGALLCMNDNIPVITAIAKENKKLPGPAGNKRVGIFTKILPKHTSVLQQYMNVKQVEYPEPESMCSSKLPAFMKKGTRIVNGEKAPRPIPWQIYFYGKPPSDQDTYSSPRCGGTIIDRKTILSAAHCIGYWHSDMKLPLLIIAGSTSRLIENKPNQAIKVEKIVQYVPEDPHNSKWSPNARQLDIVILKLEKSLEFGTSVKPACLPSVDFEPALKSKCFTSGWGHIAYAPPELVYKPPPEEDLRWTDIYITDAGYCQNKSIVTNEMICANSIDGKNACQGDSGGPLICLENGLPVLTGVTSFGEKCGKPPGIFTRVTSYLSWIKSQMEPPLAQPPQTCTTATTTTTTTTTKSTTTTTTTTTTTQQTQVCGEPMWIGDGNCDDENNFEECDYDDGDCCTDKLHLHCKKCECKEPQVCPRPYWVGDGNCDDENNIAACNFDDNDCCEDTNHNYCKECKCIRF